MAPGAEAIQMAEAAGHPYSLIHACYGHGLLHLRRGDLDRAIPVLEQGLDVCQAWGLHALSFHGVASFLGAAYVLAGRVAEALPLLERVVQQTDAMGVVFDHVLGVIPLGEGYLRAGRIEDALQQAQHAVEVCRQHHQRGHEAWALRLLGEVATRCNPPEVAQATGYYQQALTLADALGMRPLVAHCHHGLGRLYSQTGRGAQARAALTTAIDLYRAMDMTFWLPQAEAHYQQALALADELSMCPLQAHCHLGLGRLYSQTGRGEQARAELSTAIGLYRAMDMTFWLPQAEAALAQVA
jgi:tetratricopeptide (TPR) repeat protein